MCSVGADKLRQRHFLAINGHEHIAFRYPQDVIDADIRTRDADFPISCRQAYLMSTIGGEYSDITR